MPLNKRFLTNLIPAIFLLILLLSLILPESIFPQSYILEVKIADTALVGNHSNVRIPVYLKNLTDSVGAFDFKIFNNRTDLVLLKDTIIREGTLTENWEILNSLYIGEGTDMLRLYGMADWISNIYEEPAIYFPQTGEIPLFYILADLSSVSDSIPDRVTLSFVLDNPADFIVSDEFGLTVGTTQVNLIDTVYYACELWYADSCLSWVEVPGPPADSIEYWSYHQMQLDSSKTFISSGKIDLGWHLCGDLVGTGNLIDLADITSMIAYVYLGGSPPAIEWSANVNGSPGGIVDLADITWLISYVYLGGGPLECSVP